MGTVTNIVDSLRNAITGAGTKRDARAAYSYGPNYLTQADIERAYRGSGLLRKIIQIPPQDMVREWREWKLDDNEVSLVEALETALMIKQKVRAVEVLRGLGGGALIMGLPGEPSEPAPAIIGKGQLAFVHVVSRWHLTFQTLETDARKPGYGEPAMWQLSANGSQVDIHPSRVIPFRADTTAALISLSTNQADAFWGESVVAQVLSAVTDSDTARGAFAAMLHKARLTRIGMPDLSGQLAMPGGTERVQARFETLALAESMFNAAVFDSGVDGKTGETITDVAYNFAGAKDMMASLNEFVSAISDIPATRLLGRSAEGMNSSGDGQQVDWRKAIKARQELDLGPCVDRLDRYLVPSALGKAVPATGWYEWAALDTPSEKEHADRFKIIVESADKLNNMGVMPDRAFNRGIQSWLINEGMFPELEAALTEIPDDERYGIGQEEEPSPLSDAMPRPLYVRRDLLNAAELVKWAKSQGISATVDDMHVTVLYSRTAVDPMAMGETWTNEADGGLIVKAGGPRALEKFGEGALVLQFASWALISRHNEMIEAGASHDYPEYLPHVTITYQAPEGFDFEAIRPFAGELRFGPEIFEPLDLDWKSKVEES